MRKPNLRGQINANSLWPLLIPILLLLPGLGAFPYLSPDANYSDLSITHYPNAIFLKQSITEWGQIPLWSPAILSGYPFAAHPLSGLWYPPGWLALLFPLPLGFNLVVILHLVLGGLGMYLFIRALGRSHPTALFAALAFEALPKVFAAYGAGHLTMIYAISLTPWLLLAEVRNWQQSGSFWLRQPGIVLALIALADPRWAGYAGLLWAAVLLAGNPQTWRNKLVTLLRQSLIALALAAPLLLPLLEYSQLATRAQLSPADLLTYSLPPVGLLGVLAPQLGGFHEWIIYVGLTVFILAVMAILRTQKQKIDWLWIGVAVIAILFSLGEYVPGMAGLAQLPGFSLLRVPPRILPIAGFALIVLAAGALDDLLSKSLSAQSWRRARLAFVSLVALQAGLALISWVLTREVTSAYLWAFMLSLTFLGALFLFSTGRINAQWYWVGLMAITVIDLGAMDISLFASRAKEEVLAESAEAAEFLAQQSEPSRVYSPSYSIPQQTAAEYGLELANGVDPLQLQAYADFMEEATGVESTGYSITLPAFTNGEPAKDNLLAAPDVTRLALLNVGFVVSEFEVNADGLELAHHFGTTYIYRLTETLPRAYIDGDPQKAITITRWTPNLLELTAEGPGRLVLSEVMYPGWVAIVDGPPLEIEAFEGILRSVVLSEGVHQVVFEFRPLSVYAGLVIFSGATIVLMFASRRRNH